MKTNPARKIQEATNRLERCKLLAELRTTIAKVADKATSFGYDDAIIRTVLCNVIDTEFPVEPPPQPARLNTKEARQRGEKPASVGMPKESSLVRDVSQCSTQTVSGLTRLSLEEMYSTYVDKYVLYNEPRKKYDVSYLVLFT